MQWLDEAWSLSVTYAECTHEEIIPDAALIAAAKRLWSRSSTG